jgi:3-deoxy-manno-octulosonate cytidylyltransferase (CMP-KDO synthetase)
MGQMLKIGIIIPARMASERLPGKPLLNVLGLPMIEHVRRRALLSSLSKNVIVCSGDQEILATITGYGGTAVQTFREHLNGLSRVAEVARQLDLSHVIVLQGDEILILPEDLNALSASILSKPEIDFWNGVSPLDTLEELENTSIVKCTQRADQTIQTIFRKSPMTTAIQTQMLLIKKINGLFAISAKFLEMLVSHPMTPIEGAESVEQMRVLELSMDIATFDMKKNYPSINLPADVPKVLHALTKDPVQTRILNQIMNM